jgi:hypothetical protein
MLKNRRNFLLTLTAGLVAAVVIITPVIADELFGAINKVDVEGKKITVATKDGGEVEVTIKGDTEIVTGKGDTVELEKLAKAVQKNLDAGKKGVFAKVTHEGKVASKITLIGKKKAD